MSAPRAKKNPSLEQAKKYYQTAMALKYGDYFEEDPEKLAKLKNVITAMCNENKVIDPKFLFQKAASLQYIPAMIETAIALLEGSDESAHKTAFYYLNFALAEGPTNPLVTIFLAKCWLEGMGTPVDKKQALAYLQSTVQYIKALKEKHQPTPRLDEYLVMAWIGMGKVYFAEDSIDKNKDKAMHCFTLAERAGSGDAGCYAAVILLDKSRDKTIDVNKRKFLQQLWFDKLTALAERRNVEAEWNLANFYRHNAILRKQGFLIGTENLDLAISLYWRAAMGGKFEAFLQLSRIYSAQNEDKLSFTLLILASHFGDKKANFELSLFLFNDPNSALPLKEVAKEQIKKLAAENYVDAQYEFAQILLDEFKESKDAIILLKCKRYYRKAIANEHLSAKWMLATVLIEYADTDKDASYVEAENYLDAVMNHSTEDPVVQNLQKKIPLLREMLESKIQLEKKILPPKLPPESQADKAIPPKLSTPSKKYSSDYHASRARLKSPINTEAKPFAGERQMPTSAAITMSQTAVNIPERAEIIVAVPVDSKIKTIPSVGRLTKVLPDAARYLLEQLMQNNFTAYLVGGLVRNYVCSIYSDNDDVDVVTDAPMSFITKTFNSVQNPFVSNLSRFNYANRQCDIITVPDLNKGLLADALKRDFTINALYANAAGELFDPTKRGIADLRDTMCQLKSITSDADSYTADPFRILRYIHFQAAGFTSNLSSGAVKSHLIQLHRIFHDFTTSKTPKLEQESNYLQKLDGLVCKLFMSGNACGVLHYLVHYQFFEIFYPGVTLSAETVNWLLWRLSAVDTSINHPKPNFKVTRKQIYSILLAAMMDYSNDFAGDLNQKLDRFPLPKAITLRLTARDVLPWFNEKITFSSVPVVLHEQLRDANFRENYDAYFNSNLFQQDMSHQSTQYPIYLQSRDSLQGYGQHGYFGAQNPPAQQQTLRSSTKSLSFLA
jgi:tRNA nucleotidyltransferase/poly(A) polymerase